MQGIVTSGRLTSEAIVPKSIVNMYLKHQILLQLTTDFDSKTNETVAVGTAMRNNQAYSRFYVFWSKVIVTDLIPYFTILTLNSFIVTKIIKSTRFRAKILQARNIQAEVTTAITRINGTVTS